MAKNQKSWQKRLDGNTDDFTADFVESVSYDKRLYKYDIVGSIAHAKMLAQQKIISKDEFRTISDGLVEISEEIAAGKFKFDKLQEDIHMAIESALIKKTGDPGKKLHTGRSRNDQVSLDMRLWVRDQIEVVQAHITMLQKSLVKLAGKYKNNIMPAYTHLQRAQPVSIAAYLLSFVEQLGRDYQRLGNCSDLLNVSPLGAGAVAGSTLPLDRDFTAAELGFASVSRNSIDSVADRDFCAEFIFCCSLIGVHLSRLAEDWIMFSSTEYDFIRISDSYCTSSSMMPQKRNPDMLELVRGKTANTFGSLSAIMMLLKAQPMTYNRDLQEDKLHMFNAFDVTAASVQMVRAIVENVKFNTKKIAQSLQAGFVDATCLAEYLVAKGVPFRQGHGIVGSIVADCEKQGKELKDVSLEEFQSACPAIQQDVYDYLGAENVVSRYASFGSASPQSASEQISYWSEKLKEQ